MEKAVEKADLVIEAVPEVFDIKKDFYTELAKVAKTETIFASNSSTIPIPLHKEQPGYVLPIKILIS